MSLTTMVIISFAVSMLFQIAYLAFPKYNVSILGTVVYMSVLTFLLTLFR